MGPLIPSVWDAKSNGFDDVLWLLDDYVKECTVLNVFILQQSRFGHMELVTPPDDSTIINGMMRKTILEMREHIEKTYGVKLEERQISIKEIINSSKEGRLFEIFGAAPHCDLLPVHRVVHNDTSIHLSTGEVCLGLNKMIRDAMRAPAKQNKWVTALE
jgi:branched-chain amino acid aminotransferase